MTFWNEWWAWALAAVAFALLEAVIPGYAFLGLAIGAGLIAVGLPTAAALGFAEPTLTTLLLTCAVTALIAWLLMRRFFAAPSGQVKIWRRDINKN